MTGFVSRIPAMSTLRSILRNMLRHINDLLQHVTSRPAWWLDPQNRRQRGRDVVDGDILRVLGGANTRAVEDHGNVGVVMVGRRMGGAGGPGEPVGVMNDDDVASSRLIESIGCSAPKRIDWDSRDQLVARVNAGG